MNFVKTEPYMGGKTKKAQAIDLVYETVEDTFMGQLVDGDNIQEELRYEISTVIDQYKVKLEVEDVLPLFSKNWNLKDVG